MMLEIREAAASALPLPAVLDLRAAAPLADALRARQGGDLDLDGTAVSRLGGLCLQVLLAAETTWAEAGHDLVLVNPSPALVEALALLGAPVTERSSVCP